MPIFPEDTIQVLVLILRTILPCILFWISFGPKITLPWHSEYRRHSRETLLRQRDVVTSAGAGVPNVLATLLLATEETAPALFQEQKKATEKAEKKAERDRERDRERKGGGGGGRERERERPSRDRGKDRRKPPPPVAGEQPAPPPEVDAGRSEREERTHLESLVNFVAFNRREQQRTFLPKEDCAPPPPPPPPPRKAPEGGDGPPQADGERREEDERANAEAQMVLRGALRVASRAAAVAQALYGQLTDLSIKIDPGTFELMVEGCIEANNLQAASDFLMRMESSGHVPGNELLDRLMELYLRHKRSEEQKADEPEPPPPEAAPAVPAAESQWTARTEDMDLTSFNHAVDDGLGLCAVQEQPMYPAWGGAAGMAADGSLAGAAAHPLHPWGAVAADGGVQGVQAVLGRHGYVEGALGLRQRRTTGSQKASSSSSSFPAFAVPDEFRTKGEAEKQGEAAQDSEASPQAHDGEADALGSGEQGTSGADAGQAGTGSAAGGATSVLSADAAVFVPGGSSQPELFVAGEPGCFAEGEAATTAGVGAGDFEFSPGAPVFLPGAVGVAESAPPSWEPGQGSGQLGAGVFATEQASWDNQ